MASRLSSAVRKSDTVGCIGGDEFVVLLPVIAFNDDVQVAVSASRAANTDGGRVSSSVRDLPKTPIPPTGPSPPRYCHSGAQSKTNVPHPLLWLQECDHHRRRGSGSRKAPVPLDLWGQSRLRQAFRPTQRPCLSRR
ncbi:MAG: hypothetical protein CFE43_20595 [Burkholderiales bacterium PBB3]|nr:MAG: hypothetical protein CFE43_20595 [Burkholderiales bacterium PBB3]